MKDLSQEHTNVPGSWTVRRRFMFVIMAFCMGTIVYCLYMGEDTEVAQTAVSMAFLIIGTTVASYVFGAAWQDINMSYKRSRTTYRDSYPTTYDYEPRRSVYGMSVDEEELG